MNPEDWDEKFWSLFDSDGSDQRSNSEEFFPGSFDETPNLQTLYIEMLKQRQSMDILSHGACLAETQSNVILKTSAAFFVFVATLAPIAWSIWYWVK